MIKPIGATFLARSVWLRTLNCDVALAIDSELFIEIMGSYRRQVFELSIEEWSLLMLSMQGKG